MSKAFDEQADEAFALLDRIEARQINAAADFINDATRDLQPDVFAAVLQAAIARRD
jgi:hypothetical protein